MDQGIVGDSKGKYQGPGGPGGQQPESYLTAFADFFRNTSFARLAFILFCVILCVFTFSKGEVGLKNEDVKVMFSALLIISGSSASIYIGKKVVDTIHRTQSGKYIYHVILHTIVFLGVLFFLLEIYYRF